MKKNLLLSLLSVMMQFAIAQTFSYDFSADTVGRKVDGFNGWSNSTSTNYPGGGDCAGFSCNRMTIVQAALSYSGYAATTKAAAFAPQYDAPGHFLTADATLPNAAINTLTYADGDKVYAGFMVKVTDAPVAAGTNGQLIRFAGSGSNFFTVGMRLSIQKLGNKMRFGIERNGGATYTDYIYDFNVTHLIVMKYEYIAGGMTNDVASLYINPNIQSSEPAMPALTTITGTDVPLARIMFYGNQASMPTGIASGIKVGKTWAALAGTPQGFRYSQTDTISVNLNRNKCNLSVPAGGTQIANITNICPTSSGSEVIFTLDNATKCINYKGLRTGIDTACIKICNENGVCDTLNMVITTNGRVGIESLANATFIVKPTFAREQIEVILENTYPSITEIQVADAAGRVVLKRLMPIGENAMMLNINDLPEGYYFIQVQNQQMRAIQKVVVIR